MSKKRKVKLFVILFGIIFLIVSLCFLYNILFTSYPEKPIVLGTIGITFLYSLFLDGEYFGVMGGLIKWIKNHK